MDHQTRRKPPLGPNGANANGGGRMVVDRFGANNQQVPGRRPSDLPNTRLRNPQRRADPPYATREHTPTAEDRSRTQPRHGRAISAPVPPTTQTTGLSATRTTRGARTPPTCAQSLLAPGVAVRRQQSASPSSPKRHPDKHEYTLNGPRTILGARKATRHQTRTVDVDDAGGANGGPRVWALATGAWQSVSAVCVAADANSNFRPYMEDGHHFVDRLGGDDGRGYFAVFDGHGGRPSVDYAESKMHEVLISELQASPNAPGTALERTFVKVDDQLRVLGSCRQAGATAVVALIAQQGAGPSAKRHLAVANVGDTRAVLVNSRGGVTRLTYDHKASDAQEARRIVNAGGHIARGRVGGQLMVTRALGDHALRAMGVTAMPHITERNLSDADRCLILATDGVWDVMSDEDCGQFVLSSMSHCAVENMHDVASGLAQAIVNQAKSLGSTDNITAAIVFF
mmetsp:Transcript_3051/g.7302  ORF Transcript_3051/g.7302 Transcript_3051/m.7302 type:complete len:456 (+) Transcript_3051:37-1404(+)